MSEVWYGTRKVLACNARSLVSKSLITQVYCMYIQLWSNLACKMFMACDCWIRGLKEKRVDNLRAAAILAMLVYAISSRAAVDCFRI